MNKTHETCIIDLNYDHLIMVNVLNEQELNDHSVLMVTHIQSNLDTLRYAEFSFGFHRPDQFDDELQLFKLSNPHDNNFVDSINHMQNINYLFIGSILNRYIIY